MITYFLFFYILFLPLIYGDGTTATLKSEMSNKTITSAEAPKANLPITNYTKVPILSAEGGSLLPDITLNTLAKVNDVGKTDEKSSVVARKGAFLPVDIVKSKEVNVEPVNKNVSILHETSENNDTANNVSVIKKNHGTSIPPLVMGNDSNTVADKIKIHKPLMTSYDVLTKVKPLPDNSVKQLPSLNRESKVAASANSHPGMVMPIVITILLVPMFAVLGYMALKRGQEAWKNRHYKRMDFLLDGMYND